VIKKIENVSGYMTHIYTPIDKQKKNSVISMLAWLCVFLLFIGDARIPVGDSELYTPLAIFPAIILFVIRIGLFELYFLRGTFALLGVMIAGVLSTIWSDYVSVTRSVAAMFPIVTAVVILIALNGVRDLNRLIKSAVFFGGCFLAAWVALLSFQAAISDLPFYEAKLLIETPLGRSNYLAAFLLVFLAFSWNKSLILRGVAVIAFSALSIYSRGALLVFFLYVLIIVFRSSRSDYKKYFLGSLVVILSFSVLATIFFGGLFEHDLTEKFGFDPFESAENRLLLWKASLEMLWKSPLFGIGPNGFRTFVEINGLEDVWGPHNSILLLWLNYGIIGVLFYFVYCFSILQSVREVGRFDQEGNNVFVLLCILLFFSLFEPLVGSATFEILIVIIYLWSVNLRVEHGARMLKSSGASLDQRWGSEVKQIGLKKV